MTNRTRNNFRLCIQTLFSYAKGQEYLAADWSEMDSVPVWKMAAKSSRILTKARNKSIGHAQPTHLEAAGTNLRAEPRVSYHACELA